MFFIPTSHTCIATSSGPSVLIEGALGAMADLSCYITTFNCGRTLLAVDYFAANFFNGINTNLPPDLIVLALQEIAPIAYGFLGGSLLAPYFARYTVAVQLALSERFGVEDEYQTLVVRNVGMSGIMVLAKPELAERIRGIETAGVGVGYMGMGNKGAAGVRITYGSGLEGDEGSGNAFATFIAAHLAPMEWGYERRNEDWKSICEGLVFERDTMRSWSRKPEAESNDASESEPLLSSSNDNTSSDEQGMFSSKAYLFFGGDLNYRTSDTAPKSHDHKLWPQPVENVSDVQHYNRLFEGDQLLREMNKNKTLHHLAESKITFPPTYKYSDAAQDVAANAPSSKIDNEGNPWLWAKHRIPSWCDRILYLAAAPPKVHSYTALPVQPTSDHRPVALSVSIPGKPLNLSAEDVKPPFAIRKDWQEARAAARRYEFAVGVAAYLALTWEGEALLGGTVLGLIGGYLALRAMIGT